MNPSAQSQKPTRGVGILLPVAVVLLIYAWYISAGTWTRWFPSAIYDYYSNLASAFQHGHLYLEDKPSPALLALPNPYRIGARKGIPYIWDASLYKERYFLYWGPAPAVIILPLKVVFPSWRIGDHYLVFAFVSGVFLSLCLTLRRVWGRLYQALPPWILLLSILVVGLTSPWAWMLNRPEVYEAAIAAGQFFLLTGFYFLYTALDRSEISVSRIFAASASWGIAVASRMGQAIPVMFLLLTALEWTYGGRDRLRGLRRWPRLLAALLLPVVVCVLVLGWYNWARFGSIVEFGYRYQLTLLQLPKHYDEIFSSAYILPNLYNYLLNPFTTSSAFPFIKPQYGRTDFGANLVFPKIYFSEALTGLIYTFPFMILALISVAAALASGRTADPSVTLQGSERRRSRWLHFSLGGIAVLELLMLVVFFFATERYLAEAVPSLALLSVLGFWEGWRRLSKARVLRVLFSGVAICLAAAGIIASGLLAVSSYQERFMTVNPALMQQINQLFNH